MPHMSRGCLPCRTRKVKCDEGRPTCRHCLRRGDLCVGYRNTDTKREDPASTETSRSRSSQSSHDTEESPMELSAFLPAPKNLRLPSTFPWVKGVPEKLQPSVDEQVVESFFEKFVMYPCNQNSTPGFLEHLPVMFHEFPKERRLALRWAVRAAAYASLSTEQQNTAYSKKALQCYGFAISKLSESLKDPEKKPNDHTLMSIVILDLFERIYLRIPITKSQHSQGMALLLRLRGMDQIYSARGWSLFRLSHHRIQNEELSHGRTPLVESQTWMDSLNEEIPEAHVQKTGLEISKICQRARTLLAEMEQQPTQPLIEEMLQLDAEALRWRGGPEWSYKTIETPHGLVQIHRDVWTAYEWNYHRTGRIVLHEQLLKCLERVDIPELTASSIAIIHGLKDEILSTVPFMLGDIDSDGKPASNQNLSRGIGGYFLLWPMRMVIDTATAACGQREAAEIVFQRIRDCTGMKIAYET